MMVVKGRRDMSLRANKEESKAAFDTIITRFREKFPTLRRIKTIDELTALVSINSGVRDWYVAERKIISTSLETPEWLEKTTSNMKAWDTIKDERVTFSSKEASWSDRILKASDALRKTVEAVEKERSDAFKALAPLDIIDRVTVNQLPIEKAVELATTQGDKETIKTKQAMLVNDYKKYLYEQHKAGNFQNPFLRESLPESTRNV